MAIDVTPDEWPMVVHDLRSPLATLLVYTELLRRNIDVSDQPGLAEGLGVIRDAASRIERLLDRLVAVPDASTPSEVDVVEIAQRVAAAASSGVPRRVVVLSAVPELIGCWDRLGLERLFTNLIDNALKYTPSAQPVQVRIGVRGAWAEIRISDKGIGIPPADLSRVLERGFRAANAAACADGSGLGLTGVRSIVETHGGTITVQSQVGMGTTVSVRLPRSRPQERAS